MSLSTLAGIISGYKAGQITEREAHNLLTKFGVEDNDIKDLLALGIGAIGGLVVGTNVTNLIDEWEW